VALTVETLEACEKQFYVDLLGMEVDGDQILTMSTASGK